MTKTNKTPLQKIKNKDLINLKDYFLMTLLDNIQATCFDECCDLLTEEHEQKIIDLIKKDVDKIALRLTNKNINVEPCSVREMVLKTCYDK